jgi:hypothetical protein
MGEDHMVESNEKAEPKRPVQRGDFAAGERSSDVDETGTDFAEGERTTDVDKSEPDFAAGERKLPKDPNAHPDFARGQDEDEKPRR